MADFDGMATRGSGSTHGVSPELILVSDDDEAGRARAELVPVVPTDERLNAETSARLRADALAAAAQSPPPPPPAPAPVAPAPEPTVVAPPPREPHRWSPFTLRLAGTVAMIPIATVGVAIGSGWNPVGGGSSPSTVTRFAPPPPPPRIGTATSHTTVRTTHHTTATVHRRPTTAPPAPTTHAVTTHRAKPKPAPPPPTRSAPTTSTKPRSTTTAAARTTTTTRSTTTRRKPKPPPATTPAQPARTFAWPVAANATFYLVRFLRGSTVVYTDRVTAPHLTLPARFVLKPGRYRWIVRPAFGSAKQPNYGPAIVDSQLIVPR